MLWVSLLFCGGGRYLLEISVSYLVVVFEVDSTQLWALVFHPLKQNL